MNAPTALTWSDNLLTGVPEIDEQHKILVHTLNEAAGKLGSKPSLEVLESISQDLLSYALYHFETEEALMQEYGFAEDDAHPQHLEEHRIFSEQVVAIRNDLKSGTLIAPDALLDFLTKWLAGHILHTDQRLAAFILARRGG